MGCIDRIRNLPYRFVLLICLWTEAGAWDACSLTVEGPDEVCLNQTVDLLAVRSGGDEAVNCGWSRTPGIVQGQVTEEGCEATFTGTQAGEFWVTSYYRRPYDFRCHDVTKITVTEETSGASCCKLKKLELETPTIYPKQDGSRVPEGPKETKVKIVLSGSAPEEGCTILLEVEAKPFLAGHDHMGNEPLGELSSQSVVIPSGSREAEVTYRSPFPSGKRTIIATVQDFPDERKTVDVRISAGSYSLMQASSNYRFTGSTLEHGFNHWANTSTRTRSANIGANYRTQYNATIGINDMSLINGGLFDIDGDWTTPHRAHRKGTSTDMDRCALVLGCPASQPECNVDEISCSIVNRSTRPATTTEIEGYRNFTVQQMTSLCEAQGGRRVREVPHHCEF